MNFRWLVRLGAWLDARFPAKVTVTEADYRQMQSRFQSTLELAGKLEERYEKRLDAQLDRLVTCEASIAGLKKLIIEKENPVAAETKRRSDFIASGRMSE